MSWDGVLLKGSKACCPFPCPAPGRPEIEASATVGQQLRDLATELMRCLAQHQTHTILVSSACPGLCVTPSLATTCCTRYAEGHENSVLTGVEPQSRAALDTTGHVPY